MMAHSLSFYVAPGFRGDFHPQRDREWVGIRDDHGGACLGDRPLGFFEPIGEELTDEGIVDLKEDFDPGEV
jgi:hypothetical protein